MLCFFLVEPSTIRCAEASEGGMLNLDPITRPARLETQLFPELAWVSVCYLLPF